MYCTSGLSQKFIQHGLESADVLVGAAPQWVRASKPDPAMRAAAQYEEGRAWRPSPIDLPQLVTRESDLSCVKLVGQPTSTY